LVLVILRGCITAPSRSTRGRWTDGRSSPRWTTCPTMMRWISFLPRSSISRTTRDVKPSSAWCVWPIWPATPSWTAIYPPSWARAQFWPGLKIRWSSTIQLLLCDWHSSTSAMISSARWWQNSINGLSVRNYRNPVPMWHWARHPLSYYPWFPSILR